MGFLDFFKRTKSAEEIFRMNIRDAFKQCVAAGSVELQVKSLPYQ